MTTACRFPADRIAALAAQAKILPAIFSADGDPLWLGRSQRHASARPAHRARCPRRRLRQLRGPPPKEANPTTSNGSAGAAPPTSTTSHCSANAATTSSTTTDGNPTATTATSHCDHHHGHHNPALGTTAIRDDSTTPSCEPDHRTPRRPAATTTATSARTNLTGSVPRSSTSWTPLASSRKSLMNPRPVHRRVEQR